MAKAALDNPLYYVFVLAQKGAVKYDVSDIVETLKIADAQNELAGRINVTLMNVQINGSWLNGLFTVGDLVLIQADNGSGIKTVGTYTIWSKDYDSQLKKILAVTAYDSKLIYLQKSEDVRFYPKGKDTKFIVSDICKEWGVNCEYSYESITHPLKQFRGDRISEMIIEVLEEARKKTGQKYVMYADADHDLVISSRGKNDTVYEFAAKQNAISTSSNVSLEGVVTKVKIYSNSGEKKRDILEATVTGDTSYGTLQRMITLSKNDKLADSKKEAEQLIKDNGKPKEKYSIEAVDIPWIKKGDKIKVSAGDMTGNFYVISLSHDCTNKSMSMEVER